MGYLVCLDSHLGNGEHRGGALDHEVAGRGGGRTEGKCSGNRGDRAKQLFHGSFSSVLSFGQGSAPFVRFVLDVG